MWRKPLKLPLPVKILLIILFIVCLPVIYNVINGFLFFGILAFVTSGPNYAKEPWKPIDKALIEQGGVKVCESADNGNGFDNLRPWYHVYYQFNTSRDQTLPIVKQSIEQEGFILSPEPHPKHIPYFDNTESITYWEAHKENMFTSTKPSEVAKFKGKSLTLNVELLTDPVTLSKFDCDDKDIETQLFGSETQTSVKVELSLPEPNK
jgi:hypothetical protein